jgi:hypothetical protein
MEEQEDTAPYEVDEEKGASRGIGIVLGIAGLLMMAAAGLIVSGIFGPLDDLRIPGLASARFEIALDAAGIDAELGRLRELPGETLPANLGAVASARVACTVDLLAQRPGTVAIEAAGRYFLIVFAMRKQVSSPLIDPRIREISLGTAKPLNDLAELVENGEIAESKLKEWDRLVASYREASHPIYTGLQLEEGNWVYADFGKIVAAAQANAKRVGACYRARVGG